MRMPCGHISLAVAGPHPKKSVDYNGIPLAAQKEIVIRVMLSVVRREQCLLLPDEE